MKLKRRACCAAAVTAGLLLLTSCGSGGDGDPSAGSDLLATVKDKGTIRVANTQTNPPWNYVNDSGDVVGFDVDVANEVASRIGIDKVEFIQGTWENFIPGLQSGRWDAVISGQSITPERQKEVSFSIPYQVAGVGVFVAENDATITGSDDLTEATIGVAAGTTTVEWAIAEYPDADVRTYPNTTLALTDVANGRIDSAVLTASQGTYLAEQNGLPVKLAGDLLQVEVNAITFGKNEPEFEAAVNDALSSMIEDGTLASISQKWLDMDMTVELAKLES